MLVIETPERDLFNEATNEFLVIKRQTIQLEHSLVSLSKWESKWCKPFLAKGDKSDEEVLDYIRCMTITQNVNPKVYSCFTNELFRQIESYINAPMTATWFSDKQKGPGNREIITAEIIYYWMISLNVPFECQKWHLNRLLTLIRVCNIKNQPSKKRNRKEMLSDRAALNAARKAQYNTRG
jgi:hypothetical protein